MSILDDVDEPSTTAGFGEAFNGVVEDDAPEDNPDMFGEVPKAPDESARRIWANRILDDAVARWRQRHQADPRIQAHAANRAHAAYRSASAGSYPSPPPMNVVITFADAARTFAYRGLNALAGKLHDLAERIAPSR